MTYIGSHINIIFNAVQLASKMIWQALAAQGVDYPKMRVYHLGQETSLLSHFTFLLFPHAAIRKYHFIDYADNYYIV